MSPWPLYKTAESLLTVIDRIHTLAFLDEAVQLPQFGESRLLNVGTAVFIKFFPVLGQSLLEFLLETAYILRA